MITSLLFIFNIVVLVVIDQAIKWWAVDVLAPVGTMPFIPHVIELRFILNDGMAFSMFAGQQFFLIGVTSIALLGVAYLLFFRTKNEILKQVAFVLIIGGGIGNLIDRVLSGVVVDYINLLFMNFAVFNFADICVCVGAGLFILDTFLEEARANKAEK